jgi:uncharacterized protein YjbI with pentapeptide repeats
MKLQSRYCILFWAVLLIAFIFLLWTTYNGPQPSKIISFMVLLGWIVWLSTIIIFCPVLFPSKILQSGNVSDKEILEFHHKLRLGISSIVGGAAVLGGIYFSWQTLMLSRVNVELTQKAALATLELTQQKESADLYSQSLIRLDASNALASLGAIYSLERIARLDPSNYYWPVVHVLTAYIREKSPADFAHPHTYPPKADILAILDFLKEGVYYYPHNKAEAVDLSGVDISYADLSNAQLFSAKFKNSILQHVTFSGKTNLAWADFDNADLRHARFTFANLYNAQFYNANLEGVNFFSSDLTGARFYNAKFGQSTWDWLIDTKLFRADFCQGYNPINQKILERCAVGITCRDLRGAELSDETVLPKYITNCSLHRVMDPEEIMLTKAVNFLRSSDTKGFLKILTTSSEDS